jgi:hypothetical protein
MFAFVLMPFDPKFDDIYKLGIKETAEKLGITAERVDEQIFYKENILERIYNQINIADFIIADMTGRNPNVFYETGYAHANGQQCVSTASDYTGYVDRHFLKPPVRRLHAAGWAQVKLSGSKWVAFGPAKELKDKYRLTGRTLLRISTTEGSYDYPINIDLEVDELPF